MSHTCHIIYCLSLIDFENGFKDRVVTREVGKIPVICPYSCNQEELKLKGIVVLRLIFLCNPYQFFLEYDVVTIIVIILIFLIITIKCAVEPDLIAVV